MVWMVKDVDNWYLELTGTFDIQKNCEFVQCLNLGGKHWITVSMMECPPAVIWVYDSINYHALSVKMMIADLLQAEKKHIVVEHMNIQCQIGWK